MRQKKLLALLVVVLAAFILSGCGVNHSGVDITTTPPDGFWQTLVVWPLGRALIWLDGLLQAANIPYHWGWAIILFTLIIKAITFPLTLSQMRGMQAQKDLQPKIQELQKKYGKDREKLSQEQMKLYKEAGVNPLSGCLPLLIQMPVLFGLYAALVAIGPNLANANFFWIPNLGFPTYSQGMSWLTEAFNNGDWYTLIAYLILPVLLMISQFIMQKWMTPAMPQATGDSNNPTAGMTKQLTYMMTFMFGFFTLQVPAGLTLYWVTSNLLQMLQQWAITNNRLGLGSPAPNLTVATATAGNGGSSTVNAALPEPQVVESNGAANTKTGDTSNPSDKAKEARRRRAKRR
ncbi:MAG: membrane protein insertase YidC [Caldilineaceae bacterium]|nr:membrane protein insertase YidC [Caldilineaceae bacterium]